MLQFLFWLSVFGLFHSYILYPFLLKIWAKGKHQNQTIYQKEDALPTLYIVMAVYNEERVIDEKLKSIYETAYPQHRIQLLIGSDNSTDRTNEIIQTFAKQYGNIHFHNFEGRNGKIRIINRLYQLHAKAIQQNEETILILTDANVIFTPDLLYELTKHFKNKKIGLVGANVLNIGVKDSGISFQEKWYIQRENVIKYWEGVLWGSMMGAFGACYAMRGNLFKKVPENFIVDDFYLTMRVLEGGHQAIKELQAVCYEDVSDDIFEEFRRKKRISAGNFQNLKTFAHLLLPSKGGIAFAFFSHKVLRWKGPFLMITAFVTSLILCLSQNYLYCLLLFVQIAGLGIPFLDFLLKKVGIHLKLFRFITYFHLMNIALLLGFFNFIKGIKSNVWKPTKRN